MVKKLLEDGTCIYAQERDLKAWDSFQKVYADEDLNAEVLKGYKLFKAGLDDLLLKKDQEWLIVKISCTAETEAMEVLKVEKQEEALLFPLRTNRNIREILLSLKKEKDAIPTLKLTTLLKPSKNRKKQTRKKEVVIKVYGDNIVVSTKESPTKEIEELLTSDNKSTT